MPIKIATWNVDGVRPAFGARSTRIREGLRHVDADVWVLTESHPEFAPGSEYERIAVSAPAPDRVHGSCWVAMWVRQGIPAEAMMLTGEPERAAGVRIAQPAGPSMFVFGTVLPWRADARSAEYRGGRAFERALKAQATDWDAARARDKSWELCIAGDFNQEVKANGPVGTRVGREALERILGERHLSCVTGGERDPLLVRGWRANIDHVVLSCGLSPTGPPTIWPEQYPLPAGLSDHHGVCVSVAET